MRRRPANARGRALLRTRRAAGRSATTRRQEKRFESFRHAGAHALAACRIDQFLQPCVELLRFAREVLMAERNAGGNHTSGRVDAVVQAFHPEPHAGAVERGRRRSDGAGTGRPRTCRSRSTRLPPRRRAPAWARPDSGSASRSRASARRRHAGRDVRHPTRRPSQQAPSAPWRRKPTCRCDTERAWPRSLLCSRRSTVLRRRRRSVEASYQRAA